MRYAQATCSTTSRIGDVQLWESTLSKAQGLVAKQMHQPFGRVISPTTTESRALALNCALPWAAI